MEMKYTKTVLAEDCGVKAVIYRDGTKIDSYYDNDSSVLKIFKSSAEKREIVFKMCHKWADETIAVMKVQECENE